MSLKWLAMFSFLPSMDEATGGWKLLIFLISLNISPFPLTHASKSRNKKLNCLDKNVANINFHKDCNNISNTGYVYINSLNNCFIEFHNECWKAYLSKNGILYQDSPGEQCVGKILEIDKFQSKFVKV